MPLLRLYENLTTDVVAEVRSGTSVVLVGLPGSGRTAILDRAAAVLDDDGYHVLRVRGARPLRNRPLEALAVSGLAAGRPLRGASLLATYVTALENRAATDRFVMVIDDADDLDDDSVGAVVAAWGARPFPVIAATRPQPSPAGDRALGTAVDPVIRVTVPTLTFDETAQLLEEVLQAPVEVTTAGRVHAKSGGMPGLATAIARSAQRAGRLEHVHGSWRAKGDLWTPLLGESVDHLLVGLGAPGVHGLRVLALTGPVAPETARSLLSWDVLEELDEHGLLRTFPQGTQRLIGVYPPLIGEQFRHAGRSTVQLRLTEEIAAKLGENELVGWDPRERMEAVWRSDAADSVFTSEGRDRTAVLDRYLADDVARRRVVRGVEWEQNPTPATACRYLEALLMVGADTAEAARVVELTPEQGDGVSLTQLRALDSVRLGVLGGDVAAAHHALLRDPPDDVSAAFPHMLETLRALDKRLTLTLERVPDVLDVHPATWAARALGSLVRAEASLALGRPQDALAHLADAAGDGVEPAHERAARAAEADLDERASTPDDVLSHTARIEGERAVVRELALLLDGESEAALTQASRRLDEATAARDIDGVWAHGYARSMTLGALGRFAELRDNVGALLAVGAIPARQAHFAVGNLALGAYVVLWRGDLDAARTLAGQAQGIRAAPGPWPFMSIGWFDGVAAAREAGDLAGEADAFWAEAQMLGERRYLAAAAMMGMLSLGAHSDRQRAEWLTRVLADVQGRSLRGFEPLSAALVASSGATATDIVRDALTRGTPLVAAWALRSATHELRARGERAAADRLVEAVRSAALVSPELQVVYEAGDPTASLTPREREIAHLVGAGLSNQEIARRLFIAVSTVENHLNRVYRKLGADGRDRLVALLRRSA